MSKAEEALKVVFRERAGEPRVAAVHSSIDENDELFVVSQLNTATHVNRIPAVSKNIARGLDKELWRYNSGSETRERVIDQYRNATGAQKTHYRLKPDDAGTQPRTMTTHNRIATDESGRDHVVVEELDKKDNGTIEHNYSVEPVDSTTSAARYKLYQRNRPSGARVRNDQFYSALLRGWVPYGEPEEVTKKRKR